MKYSLCKHCDCDDECVIEHIVAVNVAKEREACAIIAEMYQDIARDSEFDTGVLHARAHIAKVIRSRRNTA